MQETIQHYLSIRRHILRHLILQIPKKTIQYTTTEKDAPNGILLLQNSDWFGNVSRYETSQCHNTHSLSFGI